MMFVYHVLAAGHSVDAKIIFNTGLLSQPPLIKLEIWSTIPAFPLLTSSLVQHKHRNNGGHPFPLSQLTTAWFCKLPFLKSGLRDGKNGSLSVSCK